jgi:methanogenic corrinoid protein MtbC1
MTSNVPLKVMARGLRIAELWLPLHVKHATTSASATMKAKWPDADLAIDHVYTPPSTITNVWRTNDASTQPWVGILRPGPETQITSSTVTLADAAEHLGVHYMTAYRYVRTGRMLAEKRAGQWWVTPEDLAAVIAEGTGVRRRPESGGDPRGLMVGPFTDRLVAGDTAGCWDIITDALSSGATPSEVHTQLLGAALIQVGEAWRNGDLAVADEHRATSTTYRLLGQLGPLFRHRGRRRGTIVLGAFAGDPHALPSAMLSDLLCDRRFEVIDLGANTPTESFVSVAQSCDDLIGVGVCGVLDSLIPQALAQAGEIRAALPGVCLVVGGPAMATAGPVGFEQVVDTVSLDAGQACDAFEQAASADAAAGNGSLSDGSLSDG